MVSNRTPYPLPPYTLYCTMHIYSILRGNRWKYRSQSWVVNMYMTECKQEIGHLQSVNNDKHLPQSTFTGQYFLDYDILHCLL
jgi:hypothetical protein